MDNAKRLGTLVSSIDGYLLSICAIGLIRARLSFQVRVSEAFQVSLSPESPLLHPLCIIGFLVVFSFASMNRLLQAGRKPLVLATGILVLITYVCSLIAPGTQTTAVAVIASDCFTALSFRMWGQDNATGNLNLIIIRIGISFIVQFVAYACMLVLPNDAAALFIAFIPIAASLCLLKAPTPHIDSPPSNLEEKLQTAARARALTTTIVAFCCFAHGAVFALPGQNASLWILGPLVIALIVFFAAARLSDGKLFAWIICIVIGIQCICIAPLITFSFDINLVSIVRSLGYSVTMMLALAMGCWSSIASRSSDGRSLCRWLLVYFISFYVSYLVLPHLGMSDLALLALALSCLVFAMFTMVSAQPAMIERSHASSLEDTERKLQARCQALAKSKRLTPRELEVLVNLMEGMSIKDISQCSYLSRNTIKSQVQAIYRKCGAHTRDGLKALVEQQQ